MKDSIGVTVDAIPNGIYASIINIPLLNGKQTLSMLIYKKTPMAQ